MWWNKNRMVQREEIHKLARAGHKLILRAMKTEGGDSFGESGGLGSV